LQIVVRRGSKHASEAIVPDRGAYYYLPNARFPEQQAEMARLESEGVCLFCTDEPGLGGPILHRTSHWHIRRNRFPYAGTRIHLLLIPNSHVEDMAKLSVAQEGDFWTALRWARSTFDMKFYGLGARCGDSAYTGGTIRHLHIHLLVGDVDDPGHKPVRLKLSSRSMTPSDLATE
jgi:diadenosine tetraphosphate (Ap4A) HIT family hydrolase